MILKCSLELKLPADTSLKPFSDNQHEVIHYALGVEEHDLNLDNIGGQEKYRRYPYSNNLGLG